MIAHISIGVRDIDRSKRFYNAALEPLGYKCLRAARTLSGYGYGRDSIALWVVQAEHPVPADEKSGLHFCFTAANAVAVDAFHAAALRSGGRDNGPPGLRPIYGPDYYAAFIIDPDGYRIEAYYGSGET
jgi:catechol 2,3-dioxygenase-like lactoylglutathione lyase family enzyme